MLRNHFYISNIRNIGINHLFLLNLSFNFTICLIFIWGFIFLLIDFHIPLCNVRQPYRGCPFMCNLAEITRNKTVWRMRTNNVKGVFWESLILENSCWALREGAYILFKPNFLLASFLFISMMIAKLEMAPRTTSPQHKTRTQYNMGVNVKKRDSNQSAQLQ